MGSEESETNDGSSDSSRELKKKRKHKHKEKKHKKKKNKHSSDLERKKRKKKKRKNSKEKEVKKTKLDETVENEDIPGPSVPDDLLVDSSKSRAPMTKEEWEKSQSVVRRVCDETGRSRLIKGDGEVLEEIVSRDRHREINRQATVGDGLYFQSKLAKK